MLYRSKRASIRMPLRDAIGWLRVIGVARGGSNDIAVHERRMPAGVWRNQPGRELDVEGRRVRTSSHHRVMPATRHKA
jgi:hypothetical protein